MNIALAQLSISPNPEENRESARRLSVEASKNGADMLIFPEMFMALPRRSLSLPAVAEPLEGPFVASLRELAEKYGLYIIAGIWESISGKDRVGNTVVVLSSTGELLTAYRKLHLFDALSIRESETMLAGDAFPVVTPVCGLNTGLAICYELRFPELFRHLALQGADLIVVPSAWYAGTLKEDHWLTLLRARAIENTCYVAGANLTGSAFCGRSAVFDPFGVQIADAGEGTKLLFAQIDRERLAEVRAKLPVLKHVRSDMFPI